MFDAGAHGTHDDDDADADAGSDGLPLNLFVFLKKCVLFSILRRHHELKPSRSRLYSLIHLSTEAQHVSRCRQVFAHTLGDSGEDKKKTNLSFNGQNPPAEPDSMVGGHLPRPVGLRGKQRECHRGSRGAQGRPGGQNHRVSDSAESIKSRLWIQKKHFLH